MGKIDRPIGLAALFALSAHLLALDKEINEHY
jgi:hypothetical protein